MFIFSINQNHPQKDIQAILPKTLNINSLSTVGENIITTTKIRNNYGAIQSLIFSFTFLYCAL